MPKVASALAGLFLQKSIDEGKTIEIPSLGIVIRNDLNKPSQSDQGIIPTTDVTSAASSEHSNRQLNGDMKPD